MRNEVSLELFKLLLTFGPHKLGAENLPFWGNINGFFSVSFQQVFPTKMPPVLTVSPLLCSDTCGDFPMTTRLRWLGHAALYVESDGHKVLIDPFLTGNPVAAVAADQVQADFILLSHGHEDHVGDTVAIAKRTGATVVANYEIMLWLQKQGLKNVHGMQHGGSHAFPFGRVKLTLAFHGSMLPDGSNGGNPCGFLITAKDGKKVYDAADTGLFGDMRLIGEEGIDLAILPIGDKYTMGPDDALRAVKLIGPRKVLPIHYNTFELIAQDPNAWAARVKQETKAVPAVVKPGEWVDV